MSFNVSSATSTSLTFAPSRIDISWDGVSNGKVTVLPVCFSTASTATYEVNVLHVFDQSTTKILYNVSGLTLSYSALAGEPYRTYDTPFKTAAPFTVGHTQATASGEVSFELNPADSRYTNTLDYSSYPTSQPAYYKWEIKQTRGTATQVVASGRLARIPPNPYSTAGTYGSLVQSQTASFCIG